MNFDKAKEQKSEHFEIEDLRKKLREAKALEREQQREYLLKKARFLEEDEPQTQTTSKEGLIKLANSLKSKSQVTCDSLNTIMNTLLESKENIKAFLSVDGSLKALLRALSGQNEKFQLLAARCLCNLALGESKESLQILKASESYLLAHLSGKNRYVIEACAIAVGNFSKHSPKHIQLLMNQGVLSKVTKIFNNADEDLEASVVYALTQLTYHGFDILTTEQIESYISDCLRIFQTKSFSVAFLVSLLSSRKDCIHHFFSFSTHIQAVRCLLISLKDDDKEVLYYLRIVSNCMAEESGGMAADLVDGHSYVLRECVNGLLLSDKGYLRKECLGLIGNLLNHTSGRFAPFAVSLLNENLETVQACVLECSRDVTIT